MKFLVVGLGSMGKRRVRNLQYLKGGEIIGFDPRKDRGEEVEEKYKIRTFDDFDRAMAENPDALVISTPPDLHTKYAIIAAKNDKHFFTEASVVDEGMDELIDICKNKNIVAAPSCTMRFHPAVKKIRELVEKNVIGKPLAFTYHSGQYLPDWHPWEDYRKFYVAKSETGAAREIVPFELAWLTWVFGPINFISCFKGKLSKLEADIDDVYQLILKFRAGILGHVLVDVVARVPYRIFRLLGEEGVVEWNWVEKRVKIFSAKDNKWTELSVDEGAPEKEYIAGEKMYMDEMRCFLQAIEGKTSYPYTFEEDKKILGFLYAAERSSDQNIHVKMG